MTKRRLIPIELVTLLYLLAYVPNIALTKWVSTTSFGAAVKPLTGLEILPSSLILSGIMTYAFVWIAGWWRAAHRLRLGPVALPRPTLWTTLSGIGTALVLFTVPLSLTFPGVSIPFVQLLMRGDVLLIAPVVDLLLGRKVRWWSWGALALVAAALAITLKARGGLNIPPLCLATIGLYTLGYFIRLAVMTRTAKSGEPGEVQRYYVEEKIVAIPFAIAMLAGLAWITGGHQSDQLAVGFVTVCTSPALVPIVALSVTLFVVSVFSAMILLDPRENAFCAALDRSASILAGVAAALLLGRWFGLPYPSQPELAGAALVVAAMFLLAIGPRFGRRNPQPMVAE
jgi:hypothetical protein